MRITAAVGTAAATMIVTQLVDDLRKKLGSGFALKLSNQYYKDRLENYTVVTKAGKAANPADSFIESQWEEGWSHNFATGQGCAGGAVWTHDNYDVMTGWFRGSPGRPFLYCDVAYPGTWRLSDDEIWAKMYGGEDYTQDRMTREYGASKLVGALGSDNGIDLCEYTLSVK